MKPGAFAVLPGNAPGNRIIYVEHGDRQYIPTTIDSFKTIEQCEAHVNIINDSRGVPEEVALSNLYGSMFGFNVPAAARANEFFKGKEQQHG